MVYPVGWLNLGLERSPGDEYTNTEEERNMEAEQSDQAYSITQQGFKGESEN